jgi:hypothetical protein
MAKGKGLLGAALNAGGLRRSAVGQALIGLGAVSGTQTGVGVGQMGVLSELQRHTKLLETINRSITTQASLSRQAMTGYTPPPRTISASTGGGSGVSGGANPMDGAGADGALAAAGPAGMIAGAVLKVGGVIKDGIMSAMHAADPSGGQAMGGAITLTLSMLGTMFTPMIVIAGGALMTLGSVIMEKLMPSSEELATTFATLAHTIVEISEKVEKNKGIASFAPGLAYGIARQYNRQDEETRNIIDHAVGALTGWKAAKAMWGAAKWGVNQLGAGIDLHSEERKRGASLDEKLAASNARLKAAGANIGPAAPETIGSKFREYMGLMVDQMRHSLAERSGPPAMMQVQDVWKHIQMSTYQSPMEIAQREYYQKSLALMEQFLAKFDEMAKKEPPPPSMGK